MLRMIINFLVYSCLAFCFLYHLLTCLLAHGSYFLSLFYFETYFMSSHILHASLIHTSPPPSMDHFFLYSHSSLLHLLSLSGTHTYKYIYSHSNIACFLYSNKTTHVHSYIHMKGDSLTPPASNNSFLCLSQVVVLTLSSTLIHNQNNNMKSTLWTIASCYAPYCQAIIIHKSHPCYLVQ